MSSVSITNVREASHDGRVQPWKTPWMAQREKNGAAGLSSAEKEARAAKFGGRCREGQTARANWGRRRGLMIAPLGIRGAHGAAAHAASGPCARAGLSRPCALKVVRWAALQAFNPRTICPSLCGCSS